MAADSLDEHRPAVSESVDLSGELVTLCTRFEDELFGWLERALIGQPREREVALKRAVTEVAFTLTDQLLYPTYLRFPALVPASLGQGRPGAGAH
ncbi:MAG: hypothetical protein JNJ42_10280 [Burkholderiaceae bacterium]|nr:hypothetical protein [Burkholderiaceae bacterium]